MATNRRGLHRQNTLRKTASRLELLIDDIIETIEDTTSPKNLEPYKYVCNDMEVKRITLILSIYHDWNNYIPDEIHTKLSTYKNNVSLKNEFLSNLIRSYAKYTKYHEAIFSWQELKYKKEKILHLIHNKNYGRPQKQKQKQKEKQKKHTISAPSLCGIYDFVTDRIVKYGYIPLLNDYHFILRHYYDESTAEPDKFERVYNYITERIGPCDISTCVYIKALYWIKSKGQKKNHNKFSSKEIALMEVLNEIHCLIFHSFDIHRWRESELDDIDIGNAVDNELEIDCNSLNKLHKIVCNKSNNKLSQTSLLKCEYFRTYPKYIATHDFHGIRSVVAPDDDDDDDEDDDDDDDFKEDLNPEEDTESTLDSLPNVPQLNSRWSSMRSHQKMYKWRRSIQNRSVSLFSRTLTPRIHRQNSGSTTLFKFQFGKNSKSQTLQPQLQQTKMLNHKNKKKYIKLQYLFGRKFCYWLYGKKNSDPFYVRPKHKTLKDEMIRRKLRLTEWNIMYEKASKLMQCAQCKTLNCNKAMLEKYKIHSEITLEHILSILIYCNVHCIRYDFKLSFHPLSPDDDDTSGGDDIFIKKWVKRHRKWSNFARLLRESVECFGSPFGMRINAQKVYYGIDTEIIFTKFKIGLIGPQSTTSALHFMFTAMNAMDHCSNGLILRLRNDKYPYCFNVNWLSSYSSENEYLFFGGNEFVNIHSIIHMSSAATAIAEEEACCSHVFTDYFYYINSFKLLLDIINGKWSEQYYNKKTQVALQTIIKHGLGPRTNTNYDITQRKHMHQYHFKHDDDDDSDSYEDSLDEDDDDDDDDEKELNIELPIYIRHCFERYFVEEIRLISIDLGIIDSCFGDMIRRYFVTHVHDGDEIKFNNLVTIFPKTTQIKIIGRNEMKWNHHILYKEFLEFLQIDCYLNDHLKEIVFEFPTFHYLVYYADDSNSYPLKNELNREEFGNELEKCGWSKIIAQNETEHQFIVRFYRQAEEEENGGAAFKNKKREKFKKGKNKKKQKGRSQSLQLTNGQSRNTKQLARNKNSALYAFLKEDDDISKHDGKPPIFNPAQSY